MTSGYIFVTTTLTYRLEEHIGEDFYIAVPRKWEQARTLTEMPLDGKAYVYNDDEYSEDTENVIGIVEWTIKKIKDKAVIDKFKYTENEM